MINISQLSQSKASISRASEPVLTDRCYIQVVTAAELTFLITCFPGLADRSVTEPDESRWLIGRSHTCGITIADPAISRCHAIIGQIAPGTFDIMDMGSSNGTFLNQEPLTALQRYPLKAGDQIGFSHIQVDFLFVNMTAQ